MNLGQVLGFVKNAEQYRDLIFCININIAASFYRYIDIVDIDDSSSFYVNQSKKDSKDQE